MRTQRCDWSTALNGTYLSQLCLTFITAHEAYQAYQLCQPSITVAAAELTHISKVQHAHWHAVKIFTCKSGGGLSNRAVCSKKCKTPYIPNIYLLKVILSMVSVWMTVSKLTTGWNIRLIPVYHQLCQRLDSHPSHVQAPGTQAADWT